MTLTRRGALAGLAGALALPASSRAHRLHLALTTIEWRDHSNMLEVVHRFYAHDIAPALGRPARAADLVDLRARAEAALYVADRFQLLDGSGEPMALSLLGAELEADYVFVYQEMALERPPETVTVFAGALLDVLPDQVNTVNIDFGGGVRTLEFRAGDGPKQPSP